MKAHDKLYIGLEDIGSGYVFNTSVLPNGYDEYIRKDALLKWLEGEMTIEGATEGFVGGYDTALKDVIDKIKEIK